MHNVEHASCDNATPTQPLDLVYLRLSTYVTLKLPYPTLTIPSWCCDLNTRASNTNTTTLSRTERNSSPRRCLPPESDGRAIRAFPVLGDKGISCLQKWAHICVHSSLTTSSPDLKITYYCNYTPTTQDLANTLFTTINYIQM